MAYVINYKEVNGMPRRDGTGPMGAGTMTGHGLGFCTGKNAVNRGAGLGLGLGFACRRGFSSGFGRGLAINQYATKTHKDFLQEQKELLQSRIEVIDKQLKFL